MMTAAVATGFVGRFMIMRLLTGGGVMVGSLGVVTGMCIMVLRLLCGGMRVAARGQRGIGGNSLQGQGQHQQPGGDESQVFHEVEF